MPAAWVSCAPVRRRVPSRSTDMPSSWELVVVSCSGVTSGLERQ